MHFAMVKPTDRDGIFVGRAPAVGQSEGDALPRASGRKPRRAAWRQICSAPCHAAGWSWRRDAAAERPPSREERSEPQLSNQVIRLPMMGAHPLSKAKGTRALP